MPDLWETAKCRILGKHFQRITKNNEPLPVRSGSFTPNLEWYSVVVVLDPTVVGV